MTSAVRVITFPFQISTPRAILAYMRLLLTTYDIHAHLATGELRPIDQEYYTRPVGFHGRLGRMDILNKSPDGNQAQNIMISCPHLGGDAALFVSGATGEQRRHNDIP
jgi:hypothetical protein